MRLFQEFAEREKGAASSIQGLAGVAEEEIEKTELIVKPRQPRGFFMGLLDKARELEPDARLVFWQVQADDNEYGEKYSFQKYVAVSTFLGREIVFGLSKGD